MGNRWRNILIGIVILAAIAGAVWTAMDKSEGEDKTATDSNEQGKAEVTKEEQSGDNRKAGGIREERAEEGFQAPDFTLNTLDGDKVTSVQKRGKALPDQPVGVLVSAVQDGDASPAEGL